EVRPGTVPLTYQVRDRRVTTTEYAGMTAPPPGSVAGLSTTGTTVVQSSYDSYGLLTDEVTTRGGVHTTTRHETYVHDPANWWLGLPDTSMVTTSEGACTFTVTSRVEYVPGTPFVHRFASEPGFPARGVITTRGYDAFGNTTWLESSSAGFTTRRSEVTYEPEGYFPATVKNALGHVTAITADPRTGLMLETIDPNGLRVRTEHDGFGRVRLRTADGQPRVETTYQPSGPGAVMTTVVQSETGEVTAVDVDRLGRPVRERKATTTSTFQRTFAYGALGHRVSESAPYSVSPVLGVPSAFATRLVDNLGLVRTATNLDGETEQHWHEPFASFRRDGSGFTWQQQRDLLGRTTAVVEPAPGGTARYAYCGGQLSTVTDAAGNVTRVGYDVMGRRTSVAEPNSGTTSYRYTPFDELASVTDGRGRITRYSWDVLGRQVQRDDVFDGTTTRWHYDTGLRPSGLPMLGALHRTVGPGGAVNDTYGFDDFGRVVEQRRDFPGLALVANTAYDTFGRVTFIKYPAVLPGTRVQSGFSYSAAGELSRVTVDGAEVWRLVTSSAFGRPALSRLGHGVDARNTFSPSGRLTAGSAQGVVAGITVKAMNLTYEFNARGLLSKRTDAAAGRTETYSHDGVERLTSVASTDASYVQSYGYDVLGNLTSAHDVPGGLLYERSGGAGPNAVTKVGTVVYQYDAAGNLSRRGATLFTYNQRNLPTRIDAAGGSVTYTYDAEGQRATRTRLAERTWYLPGLFELRDLPVGRRETVYVTGPADLLLQVDRTLSPSTGAITTRKTYLHRDRQGSVVGASSDDGSYSRGGYDAFGKVIVPLASNIVVGFTSHERDSVEDLIDMKGRLFDSRARRFISVDPLLSGVTGQHLNRYSYVRNRPLNAIDQSGFTEPPTTPAEAWVEENGRRLRDDEDTSGGDVEFHVRGNANDSAASERGGAGPSGLAAALGDPSGPGLGRQLSAPGLGEKVTGHKQQSERCRELPMFDQTALSSLLNTPGMAERLNPHPSALNCPAVAAAVDEFLDTRHIAPAAGNNDPGLQYDFARRFGSTHASIQSALSTIPPGRMAVIRAHRPPSAVALGVTEAHYFNVVNNNGTLIVFDLSGGPVLVGDTPERINGYVREQTFSTFEVYCGPFRVRASHDVEVPADNGGNDPLEGIDLGGY
ncbi:MAG: RHS repeat protein, partial [Myxococcaceae bacterium]|nr:RHS repeat protein [Myxococcaceae bacterium]